MSNNINNGKPMQQSAGIRSRALLDHLSDMPIGDAIEISLDLVKNASSIEVRKHALMVLALFANRCFTLAKCELMIIDAVRCGAVSREEYNWFTATICAPFERSPKIHQQEQEQQQPELQPQPQPQPQVQPATPVLQPQPDSASNERAPLIVKIPMKRSTLATTPSVTQGPQQKQPRRQLKPHVQIKQEPKDDEEEENGEESEDDEEEDDEEEDDEEDDDGEESFHPGTHNDDDDDEDDEDIDESDDD